MVESCNGVLGTKWTVNDAVNLGAKVLEIERKFNKAAGFTKAHDRPPEFMRTEALPPKNVVFDVSDAELDRVFPD